MFRHILSMMVVVLTFVMVGVALAERAEAWRGYGYYSVPFTPYGYATAYGYAYPGAPYYQGYGPPYYSGNGPPYYQGYGPPYVGGYVLPGYRVAYYSGDYWY